MDDLDLLPRFSSPAIAHAPSIPVSSRHTWRGPLAALVVALTAVGAALSASPALAQNAAVVNGKPIPSARVDEFMKMLAAQGRPDNEETRKLVRDELIAREVFSQEAEKRGLEKAPEVRTQLASARQDILIRAMIRNYLEKNPVSDAQIQTEYDKLSKETSGGKEYKVRHILVEGEDDAKKIIVDIKGGAKFADLAKQSKDPGSGAAGGDLGWSSADTFVKEFSEAMVALPKGGMTDTPVKTQFGYHIIEVEDIRDAAPPPLDQVKPQLKQQLERAKVQDLQKQLRAEAKVE